jgi:hypothetical protein
MWLPFVAHGVMYRYGEVGNLVKKRQNAAERQATKLRKDIGGAAWSRRCSHEECKVRAFSIPLYIWCLRPLAQERTISMKRELILGHVHPIRASLVGLHHFRSPKSKGAKTLKSKVQGGQNPEVQSPRGSESRSSKSNMQKWFIV